MRIWSIILAGAGLSLAAPALAGEPVAAGTSLPMPGKSFAGVRPRTNGDTIVHRWGPRFQGRWFAGWQAPGSWAAYRRPVGGYVLPAYWMNPGYRIGNYGAYGLPAPADGYGWSRYYDDAVMVDGHGQIKDHRSGIDWDGPEGDAPPPSLGYDDDVTMRDVPPPAPLHEYEGRWTGTWRDENGRTYSGDYEGRFEGEAHSNHGVDYTPPPYAPAPHVTHHGGPGAPVVTTTHAPGYYAGGYYYPGATTTTVIVQPAVTTTRTYVTEVTRRPGGRGKTLRRCNCR